MKLDGIVGIEPHIKKIDFNHKGYLTLILEDGRIIMSPVSCFPSIKKLDVTKRKKNFILGKGEGVVWEHSDYILHIQDVLGLPIDYIHKDMRLNQLL